MSRLALLEDAAAFPDGSWVTARQIVRSDGRHVSQFIGQMSEESEYLQFLSSSGNQKTVWVPRLINADQVDHLAYGAFFSDRFGSSLVALLSRFDIGIARTGQSLPLSPATGGRGWGSGRFSPDTWRAVPGPPGFATGKL